VIAGKDEVPWSRAADRASAVGQTTSHCPVLADARVHVLMANVAAHALDEDSFEAVLCEGERERASRFVFERDRAQYVVAHGLLRMVLARYLGAPPAALRFDVGRYGKPRLADANGGTALTFNLSHTSDLVVIAVARHRAVGVDVERWLPKLEHEEVAERYFSRAEQAELRSLPPDQKIGGFFACWTRKEAYIKATGFGVSRGLDYFDVTVAPGKQARIIADRLGSVGVNRWTLHDLALPDSYSGAVVGEGCDWRLEQLVVSPSGLASSDASSVAANLQAQAVGPQAPSVSVGGA